MYSLVVPTFNRATDLGGTLESLLSQEAELEYEIIVVDNNSSDQTCAVVRRFEERAPEKVRYVLERTPGASAARNAGIAAARGEVVVFTDDDAVPLPGWLSAIASAYAIHPDAWCVGGKIVADSRDMLPPWFNPSSKLQTACLAWLDLGNATIKLDFPSDLWGPNFSVKRTVLSQTGLFRTDLGPGSGSRLVGEESDMCFRVYRAGGSVYYCGQAVVVHKGSPHFTKRYFRQTSYWRGRTVAIVWSAPRPLWRRRLSAAAEVLRASARLLWSCRSGDVRTIFERELILRFQLGVLCQTILGDKVTPRRASNSQALFVGPNHP